MVGFEQLPVWMAGNRDALELANMFIEMSQLWDDLIDEDQPVPTGQREKLMRICLIDIPKNHFYQQHFSQLHPVMEEKIYTWMDCNEIERISDSTAQLNAAYVLRSVVTDLVIHLAFLAGGYHHRVDCAFAIRLAIYEGNESFEEYLKEHRG